MLESIVVAGVMKWWQEHPSVLAEADIGIEPESVSGLVLYRAAFARNRIQHPVWAGCRKNSIDISQGGSQAK